MFGTRTARTALVVLLALGTAGCERWRLDQQMEVLCKQDGGIKVYETVTLPASEFSNVGQPLARYAQQAKSTEERLGPDYRYVWQRTVLFGVGAKLEAGEGTLVRNHHSITRRADGRLLGESVSYARGGGDGFTFGFQPSGNHCPNPRIDLIGSVFIKGN
jgi:hypothetical protein